MCVFFLLVLGRVVLSLNKHGNIVCNYKVAWAHYYINLYLLALHTVLHSNMYLNIIGQDLSPSQK